MIIYILLVKSKSIWEASDRIKNRWGRGFPGGSVVKNPPAHAVETGWLLIQEDPPGHRATKPWAPTVEPVLWSLGRATPEAWAGPCSATRKATVMKSN